MIRLVLVLMLFAAVDCYPVECQYASNEPANDPPNHFGESRATIVDPYLPVNEEMTTIGCVGCLYVHFKGELRRENQTVIRRGCMNDTEVLHGLADGCIVGYSTTLIVYIQDILDKWPTKRFVDDRSYLCVWYESVGSLPEICHPLTDAEYVTAFKGESMDSNCRQNIQYTCSAGNSEDEQPCVDNNGTTIHFPIYGFEVLASSANIVPFNGNFFYINSSSGSIHLTKWEPGSTRTCLNFWYYASGTSNITINIKYRTFTIFTKDLLEIQNDQIERNEWIQIHQDTMHEMTTFDIIANIYGDDGHLAIDDVTVKHGWCFKPVATTSTSSTSTSSTTTATTFMLTEPQFGAAVQPDTTSEAAMSTTTLDDSNLAPRPALAVSPMAMVVILGCTLALQDYLQ